MHCCADWLRALMVSFLSVPYTLFLLLRCVPACLLQAPERL